HQVHQRRLAGAVRPDQARDAGRDVQRDAIHAEHLTVELRDLLEDDRRLAHRTTSTGRSLRSITRTSSAISPDSARMEATAPGPFGGSTPSSVHHTRLTDHAGSMRWP